MNNAPREFLIWTQLIVHSVLMLATFCVLITGWKRHRQLGYVVLAAWAAVSASWTAGLRLLMPHIQSLASQINLDATTVYLLSSLFSGLLLSLLLLTGLCLIVFQPGRKNDGQE